MTVGSVCGLSGTLLAVFVPATRLLSSMSADNLLPLSLLAHTSKKRGVPYYAILLCALITSSMVILNTSELFDIVAFSTPLRLILLVGSYSFSYLVFLFSKNFKNFKKKVMLYKLSNLCLITCST